jgi:hypothetical protein
MIEACDWPIAFQGSQGSNQSYCNNELSPFSRRRQMQRGKINAAKGSAKSYSKIQINSYRNYLYSKLIKI